MKKQITLRIDAEVLEWFRSRGKGYQGRMNDALRLHTKRADILNIVDDFKYKDIPDKIDNIISKASISHDNFFKPMPKTGKKKK